MIIYKSEKQVVKVCKKIKCDVCKFESKDPQNFISFHQVLKNGDELILDLCYNCLEECLSLFLVSKGKSLDNFVIR